MWEICKIQNLNSPAFCIPAKAVYLLHSFLFHGMTSLGLEYHWFLYKFFLFLTILTIWTDLYQQARFLLFQQLNQSPSVEVHQTGVSQIINTNTRLCLICSCVSIPSSNFLTTSTLHCPSGHDWNALTKIS